MRVIRFLVLAASGLFCFGGIAGAQSLDQLRTLLEEFVAIPAVSGHEEELAAEIAERLRETGLTPEIDRASNVTVTIGSGAPRRLIVANIDEPGYVVSGWSDDGYLRMARVGPAAHGYIDQYFEGQRVQIGTSRGIVTGVTSIPSTHLRRGRPDVERPFDLADAYIDLGAGSVADIEELGIRMMDPISLEKTVNGLAGDRVAGPFLSDRVGAAALVAVLTRVPSSEIEGTLTVAFVTQEHFGRRGLGQVAERFDVEEAYVFEAMNLDGDSRLTQLGTGIGVDASASPDFGSEIERFQPLLREDSMRPAERMPDWNDASLVRIGVPVMFHLTPVEVLDLEDLSRAVEFLRVLVTGGQS